MAHGEAVEAALLGLPSSPPRPPRLRASTGRRAGRGQGRLRETPGRDDRRQRPDQERRREQEMNGDLADGDSVPRGAGDEEAHVVQRPPRTGLRPGPLRALGRRELRLGLCLLRGAVAAAAAAAQLSAHGLREEKPVRRGPSRTPPGPRPAPPSPRAAGAAGVFQRRPPRSARCAQAPGRAGAVTSPRGDTALGPPERSFRPRERGPANSAARTSKWPIPHLGPGDPPRAQTETSGTPTHAPNVGVLPRLVGGCPGRLAARPAPSIHLGQRVTLPCSQVPQSPYTGLCPRRLTPSQGRNETGSHPLKYEAEVGWKM